jgi:hypothetical protein
LICSLAILRLGLGIEQPANHQLVFGVMLFPDYAQNSAT